MRFPTGIPPRILGSSAQISRTTARVLAEGEKAVCADEARIVPHTQSGITATCRVDGQHREPAEPP